MAIPANVSDNVPASVMAGLPKLVAASDDHDSDHGVSDARQFDRAPTRPVRRSAWKLARKSDCQRA